MKKLALIPILILIAFLASGQYVVPRGLPYKDNRYVNYAAPQGFILLDSLAMFRSIGDTLMKPLYPGLGYIGNFAGDSTFWVWDMVRWKKLGGGGISSDSLFGIKDNVGIQDRDMDMENFNFYIHNNASYEIRAISGSADFFLAPGQVLLNGNDTANDVGSFISVNPTYINFYTNHSNVPPKLIAQSSDSLTISSPTRIAVWDGDTLKSANASIFGTGTLTNITFTDGSGFDGTITNPATTPDIKLTTQLTLGSVPFIGTSGALRENNPKFFWDSTNAREGIGNKAPRTTLEINGNLYVGDTLTANGDLYHDRASQFYLSATAPDITTSIFPRAYFSQLTTAGSTNFVGGNTSLSAGLSQVILAVNVTSSESVGFLGRTWATVTDSVTRAIGTEGGIDALTGANFKVRNAIGVAGSTFHEGGTITADTLAYFESIDHYSPNLTENVQDKFSAFFHDYPTGGHRNWGVYQKGSGKTNVFEGTVFKLPNIPNGINGDSILVVNGAAVKKVASSTFGTGTVTSVATGLGLSGGTITTTGTIVLDTSSSVVLSRQRAAATYLTANQAIVVTATGDATGTSTSSGTAPSLPLVLATVNSNVGSFGDATHVGSFTVNAKGLVTAASSVAITGFASSTLTSAHLFVGNGSNVATDVAASGDLTLANTGAFTFNTVNSNVGTFGSATQVAQVTVNAKGLTTAVSNVTITPAASSITGGAALTKVDDTNVTLTLGGTPSTSLLAATSLTLGWTGTLGVARGGTNIASYAIGDFLYASGSTTLSKLADVAAGSYLRSGGVTTAPVWSTVTLPNAATSGDIWYASATSTISALAKGSDGQVLTLASGIPSWATQTSFSNTLSSAGTLTLSTTGFYTFNGTTTTWTLPVISGNTGVILYIKNRGSGNITLNSNAGGNDIYVAAATNSLTIEPGTAYTIYNDSGAWVVE